MIEPIQGEGGGVHVVDNQFLRELRELCDTNGLLLVLDEVQTGMGRTGELFAFQHTGVTPDIMALAKALGGGFPMGAFLTTAAAGKGMTAGTHGSTFGGNPLAMAASNATLDVMLAPGFFDKMRRNALLFKQRLAEIKDRHPAAGQFRHVGRHAAGAEQRGEAGKRHDKRCDAKQRQTLAKQRPGEQRRPHRHSVGNDDGLARWQPEQRIAHRRDAQRDVEDRRDDEPGPLIRRHFQADAGCDSIKRKRRRTDHAGPAPR
jgi:4-aminobutyrate aminotransferase-like enzyme